MRKKSDKLLILDTTTFGSLSKKQRKLNLNVIYVNLIDKFDDFEDIFLWKLAKISIRY